MPRTRLFAALLTVILTVPPGWARKPGEAIKPGWNLFSKDQDVQLGKEYAGQIQKQYEVVSNKELQDFLGRMGRRLASQPEAGDYPYTFTLVNDPSINAFALPGGPAFVHTGLIAAADNEAQVAGVLGHEIAHVALRHGTNQASKAQFMQIPAILAGAVTGSNLLAAMTQIGAQGFLLKFSRTAEDQADALGTRMMARAGYNPIEMARFFEKLEAESKSRAPQFLSDHPNPGNRVKAVEAEVAVLPRSNYTSGDPAEFERMKAMVKKLPAPAKRTAPAANQNQGSNGQSQQQAPASLNVPTPSERFRQHSAQGFAISYPDNWEVFGGQNSANLTIAPRSGIVSSGNSNAIAYGAIVGFFQSPGGRRSVTSDTQSLLEQLQSGNPGLKVAGRSKRLSIDGSSALLTPLVGASPLQGQREQNALLTVDRQNGIVYVVFIAPERDYAAYQRTFEEMTRSLRFSN